jgi:hypothetical protein
MVITGTQASVTSLARPIWVKKVYWFNPVTSGDDFKITDGDDANVLLEGQSEANNQSQNFDFDPPALWKNFKTTVLGSGTLYIYH